MKALGHYKTSISVFLSYLIIFFTISCGGSGKELSSTDSKLYRIGEIHKSFIIHSNNNTYTLSNISLDGKFVYGQLSKFNEEKEHETDLVASANDDILYDIHIHVKDGVDVSSDNTRIALGNIGEIGVVDKKSDRTVGHFFLMFLLAVVIGAVVLALLAALAFSLKGSCPYIYVFDGEKYVFTGESFGGAITQNIERDDYVPLPKIKAVDGEYRMRISNELKERQYTDIAELITVNHAENQKILLDKYGNPQILENPVSGKARDYSNNDQSTILAKVDSFVYFFNDTNHVHSGLVLHFHKNKDSDQANLVIQGKNSFWFEYVYGEFTKKFGNYYNKWIEKQSKLPTEEFMQTIKECDFPLSIYIMKDNQWEFVDFINTIGPMAGRKMIVPIDISDMKEESVSIKLETGFMFWEIDYVGMDFNQNKELVTNVVSPSIAYGTGNLDFTHALTYSDKKYMAQENIGEVTEIIYKVPPCEEGLTQSVFLHTRGYYEPIREYEGMPDFTELYKFRTPGYFAEYSRQLYLDMTDDKALAQIQVEK